MNAEPGLECTAKICFPSPEKVGPWYLGGSMRPHPMQMIAITTPRLILFTPQYMFIVHNTDRMPY
jgi:hypothetical protein